MRSMTGVLRRVLRYMWWSSLLSMGYAGWSGFAVLVLILFWHILPITACYRLPTVSPYTIYTALKFCSLWEGPQSRHDPQYIPCCFGEPLSRQDSDLLQYLLPYHVVRHLSISTSPPFGACESVKSAQLARHMFALPAHLDYSEVWPRFTCFSFWIFFLAGGLANEKPAILYLWAEASWWFAGKMSWSSSGRSRWAASFSIKNKNYLPGPFR